MDPGPPAPRRDVADVIARARKVLATAELGLADLAGKDPRRSVSGWHNVISFGRAVTFVLQNLRTIDEAAFDAWYVPRREAMRTDPLLEYFHRLRNELEKEGGAEMTSGLYVKSLDTRDLTYILAHPPPGATGFFMFDTVGGSGWDVALPDGGSEKYYVDLPPTVQARAVLEAPDPPKEHLGQPIADRSAPGLARLYVAYLSRLVSEAETHFSKLPSASSSSGEASPQRRAISTSDKPSGNSPRRRRKRRRRA